MEYFILIVLFSTSFSQSVSKTRINLLDDLKAPLFAELDFSNVQNYIDAKIDTRLDHINDTLDDRIESLVDNLDKTKLENDERVSGIISDFKSLEDIVKNLKNENKQLKKEFTKWQKNYKNRFPARDCSDIDTESRNGVYKIFPILEAKEGFKVYCDMETDGGGWTVFQRRINGETDFYRSWLEYQKGFGDLEKEFWLGNDKLHTMTSLYQCELRIGLEDFKGQTGYAKYTTFSIGDASNLYKLSVSGYSGTIGNSLESNNGQLFTTKDSDNEQSPMPIACPIFTHGAWWFSRWCGNSNLNGKYFNKATASRITEGITWKSWKGNWNSLKKTYMMIRRL